MRRTSIVVFLALTVACASLSVKQSVSAAHQTVRGALVAFDEEERARCQPAPAPKSNTCTANPIVITDAQHQKIRRTLADAYRLDIRVGCAISNNAAPECAGLGVMPWFAGAPVPVDLTLLEQVAAQIKQAALEVSPSSQVAALIAKAEAIIQKVQAFVLRFTGGFHAS